MATESDPKTAGRPAIIETVKTPLGFFSLVVLVVEALLATTAARTGGTALMWIVLAMVVLIFLLVGIVAFFAYYRPEALWGKRASGNLVAARSSVQDVETFSVAKVLCAATSEFEKLGFKHDVELLKGAFRRRVEIVDGLSSDLLRHRLTTTKYGVVHLLLYVDPTTGDIGFGNGETLSAEGFEKLVEVCGARLIVLATCDSLTLAAKISRKTNMIAASTSIAVKDFERWARAFYGMLGQGRPLSQSFELATATSDAPMILLMRRDLRFK